MEKSIASGIIWNSKIQSFASLFAKGALIWLIGFPPHLIFSFMKLFGIISVKGRFPSRKPGEGIFVIHNHPSRLETVLIPLTCSFFSFLLNPSKAPCVTPKLRYWGKWWFRLLFGPFSIPMVYGDAQESNKAILRVREALRGGGTVIVMPEGGRTGNRIGRAKGRRYKVVLSDGIIREVAAPLEGFDPSWHVIRRFQPGVGEFIRGCENVKVLPMWVGVSRWRIKIIIGEPVTFGRECSSEFIRTTMETILLRLSLAEA